MRWRATHTTHGTRNSAANSARPSDTTAVPKNGAATRRKMYWNDHMVASASHRVRSEEVRGAFLQIYALHGLGGVARAGAGPRRGGSGDAPEIFLRQRQAECREIFVDALAALGAWNGDDVLALREHPGQRELRRRAALLTGNFFNALRKGDVLVQRIALEARMLQAAVALGQVGLAVHRAGQHAAAERRVGDERDAELPGRLEGLLSLFSVQQGIFVLHGGNGMHLVRAMDGLGTRLRQTQRAHFALLDEALHRADRVLDRRIGINAMLVIEVDDVDPEPLQAGVAGLLHVLRAPVDARLAVG